MTSANACAVFAVLLSLDLAAIVAASARNRLDTQSMPVSNEDILTLYRTLSALDSQLHDYQKYKCDSNSELCDFSDWSSDSDVNTDAAKYSGSDAVMLQNIIEQRRAIETLKRLLHAMDVDSNRRQPAKSTIGKRTCRLRLGGHCLTEALDNAATQYWYLKSPHSPGRRRRSSEH